MEVVEKKEMVHKDVYESGEKEYASKGVAGTGLGLIYQVLIIVIMLNEQIERSGRNVTPFLFIYNNLYKNLFIY